MADAEENGAMRNLVGEHSMRPGGATSLYVMGVDLLLLQIFGRWQADSYLIYLRRGLVASEPHAKILARTTGMLVQLQQHIQKKLAQIRQTDCRSGIIGRSGNYRPAREGRYEGTGRPVR